MLEYKLEGRCQSVGVDIALRASFEHLAIVRLVWWEASWQLVVKKSLLFEILEFGDFLCWGFFGCFVFLMFWNFWNEFFEFLEFLEFLEVVAGFREIEA